MTDLADLKISREQCQDLLAIDAIAPLVLDGVKVLYLRQPQAIVPFLLTEGFLLFVLLILVLPVVLVVGNNQLNLDGTAASGLLLELTLGVALAMWLGVNGFLGRRGWRLRSLALLHHRIEQYNQLVTALAWGTQLTEINATPSAEVYETLATLRDSLLNRIRLERLHHSHRAIQNQHQALIAQLDQQLDSLLQAETPDPSSEAAQLLQEAIELGVQVHREVRELRSR